jgi:transposase
VTADICQHCGADVSAVPQAVCDAFDRIGTAPVTPDVTRVSLHGGTCPWCARTFKAACPANMSRGSPFGPNLRALVIHLRFTQGIAFERLARLLSDLLGLAVSQGALVNMLAAPARFRRQTSRIRAALMGESALESGETGRGSPNGTGGCCRAPQVTARHQIILTPHCSTSWQTAPLRPVTTAASALCDPG